MHKACIIDVLLTKFWNILVASEHTAIHSIFPILTQNLFISHKHFLIITF
jgi:hypothetical protein